MLNSTEFKKYIGIKQLTGNYSLNTYDLAKFFAIILMIIDHIGTFILPDMDCLRGLGRGAFPIFFFLIGYSGYYKNSWNLLIIGILLTAYKGFLAGIWLHFDILITVFFTRLALKIIIDKKMLQGYELCAVLFTLFIWHIGIMFIISYGSAAVMYGICGYFKKLENDTGNKNKYLKWYLAFTFIFDMLSQRLLWTRVDDFIYIYIVVSILVYYYLMNFRLVTINSKTESVEKLVLFFSRNSLFIYWLHLVILVLVSYLLEIKLEKIF